MEPKRKKTYSIRINNPDEIAAIEYLTKSAILQGKSLAQAIAEYAKSFYIKEYTKSKFTPVTENQLIDRARKEGLTTGKASIVQYRRKGVLQDKDGTKWFFQNDQHKIVYNLEKMLAFLKERHRTPKSRMINAQRPGPTTAE